MTRTHARPVSAFPHRVTPPGAWPASLILSAWLACGAPASAQTPPAAAAVPPAAASAPPPNSAMDAPMFYQLLVGEMEAQAGRQANAFEVMLDAARRTRDGALFQRAVELAVQARSADRALVAAKAWRDAQPASVEATRTTVQLLAALDRPGELAEPLRTLIQQVGADDRSAVIASIPRFLRNAGDKERVLGVVEQALAPFVNAEATRTAARTTLGRLALAADHEDQALSLARRALADDPAAVGPMLLALELSPRHSAAEALLQSSLARPDVPAAVRMAYARTLEQRQHMVEAVAQIRLALQQQPDLPQGWLSLGAALLDLHQSTEAHEALTRALAQIDAAPAAQAAADDEAGDDGRQRLREVIWQLLAQAAEQRGDDKAVSDWLSRIPADRVDLPTLVRQAGVLARQGQLDQARRMVREGAVAEPPTARGRLMAEVQLLRSLKHWQDAYDLLLSGLRETPDDTLLIYEMAMVAERLKRFDDMEALLRRAIALKPDDPQALNALGYTLADRNQRLDEAQALIARAVALSPNDPFIADSLGWVEFRRGHHAEALRVLREAYGHRPHVEVAAHLGEVLWADGQRDEALRVWRDGAARESDNEVLQETLARLKVRL